MSDLHVSHNPTIAAQQLATQRENINANPYVTPEAKEWQIRYLERDFANAMYGQTLSWPARLVWALASIPASLAWSIYNFPDVLRYGMLGGHGGVAELGGSWKRLAVEDEPGGVAGHGGPP